MPDANGIPTTAEMDGWFGDPDDPERWQTYYQCNSCGEWTLVQGSKESHGHPPKDSKCECGGAWANQSATSKRTFDVERAKKRTALIRRKKK